MSVPKNIFGPLTYHIFGYIEVIVISKNVRITNRTNDKQTTDEGTENAYNNSTSLRHLSHRTLHLQKIFKYYSSIESHLHSQLIET